MDNVLIPCLYLAACTLPISAQDPEPRQNLRLHEYVEAVLHSNLDAAAQRFNVTIAEAQVSISRLLPDPEFSAGISSKELHGPSKPASPTQYEAGLSWTLELGGKRAARIAVARVEVKKAQAEFTAFLDELRVTAAGVFADALKARLVLERQQKTLEGFKELVHLNEIRHATGDIGGVELTQSKVEARRFESEVFKAQAERKAAEALLAQLLGNAQTPVTAAGSMILPSISVNVEALLTQALAHRPALQAARHSLDVAESQKRLAKANRWVDLGLSLGVNHTPQVLATGLDASGAPFPAPANKSNTLSFGVSIPLPFSRRQKGELIQADSARAQARLLVQSAEQQTRSELLSTIALYESTSSQLAAFRSDILQDSDKVLEGIQFSYKRGSASLLEWINAQRTNHEVHLAYLETLANHIKALLALDRISGNHSSLMTEKP
jgi:cobalt-zinc-cadmium efflux system outer membrane protein